MKRIKSIVILVCMSFVIVQTAQAQDLSAEDYSSMAYNAYNTGNCSEAIRLGKLALQMCEKEVGKEDARYAEKLHSLSMFNYFFANYSDAIELATEALQIRKKIFGTKHQYYLVTLNLLAMLNDANGDYSEAIRLGKEVLQVHEQVSSKEDSDNATYLYNLAVFYSDLGNYSEAVRLATEALLLLEKTLGKENPNYTNCLSSLANYYNCLYEFYEAIRLYNEVSQIVERSIGKENPDYAACLGNLAGVYSNLGKYSEAVRMRKEALQILEKTIGKENPAYAAMLNNLAGDYSRLGNNSEAVLLVKDAIRIQEKELGKDHIDYAASLKTLAGINYKLGNYFEAVALMRDVLRIQEREWGKDHPNYAINQCFLALYCSKIGNYSGAVSLCTEAMQIINKTFGKEDPWSYRSLMCLASYYEGERDFYQFQKSVMEAYSLSINYTLRISQSLTKADRECFWNQIKNDYEYYYQSLAYKYNSFDFTSVAYNAALLSKGFLLNSEIETRKIITESNDAALVALYDSMRVNQQILDKQQEKPIKERCVNVDSLRETITKMERELASKSTAYGSLIANMSVEWKDVQRKLGKNDIAVEFLNFPIAKDSIMYVALTLKKGYESPKMIPLFEEKQLKSIHKDRYYKGTNIYNLVWKPLEKELEGVTNVYFSPSGELYNINIEVLPEITQVKEERRYYRLSSTRGLALQRVESKNGKASAAIYGGIAYNSTVKSLLADSEKYKTIISTHRSIEDFNLSCDSAKVRGAWGYLPGSLVEAREINNVTSAKMASSLLTDTIATETSFKALEGQKRKIIHIATHGFYYTEKDTVRMKDVGFQLMGERQERRYVEDKALTRSGLLFAGCNNILKGDTLPEDADDGILYAKEIARMDLRGLDILTLSACETGLGDITGEGVFGLQRAFKKAGAQSILMSLWKVDDRATRLFMTRFYEDYLIRKMSKSDALLDAQKYVREYEVKMVNPDGMTSMKRKYENPDYWAAFILLDAI